MVEAESMQRKAALLLTVADRLSVPVLATEQYPEGLGRTLPERARLVPKGATIDKRHFDAVQAPTPEFRDILAWLK